MSHNFKVPHCIDARERRKERQLKIMATTIPNQERLDRLLEGSTGQLREALLARVAPYLSFVPDVAEDLNCPHCGRRGGKVINHECVLKVDSAS